MNTIMLKSIILIYNPIFIIAMIYNDDSFIQSLNTKMTLSDINLIY